MKIRQPLLQATLILLVLFPRAVSAQLIPTPGQVFAAGFSSSNTVRNISGFYQDGLSNASGWIQATNTYQTTMAVDDRGKAIASGSISGAYTTNGLPITAKGKMTTVKGVSTADFQGAQKNVVVLGTGTAGLPTTPTIANGNGKVTFQFPAGVGLSPGEAVCPKCNATGGFLGVTNSRGAYKPAAGVSGTIAEFPTNASAGVVPWYFNFVVYTNQSDGKLYAKNALLQFATNCTTNGIVQYSETQFAEAPAQRSSTTGDWTIQFNKPTNGDTLARMSVNGINPTNPSAGSVSYKFLGQSGSGAAGTFNPVY